MKRYFYPVLFVGALMAGATFAPQPGHAARANMVTDVFADSVTVFGPDHKPMGKLPAAALLHRPVVGEDPTTGLLRIQTDKGVVMVKPGKVGTSAKVELPAEGDCRLLRPASASREDSSTSGLASGCN
ncbi:hypothetical protein [Komagataeibacter kakiaceti]|uniref:hypothetical protein n=1 Tax=Komagataeibacter kakiaceti TaxID=943261 RepID=UPI0011DE0112|nr:hypothetical protein [Komagataeibacter kakiaceti]